jgi:hypothetical protein
LAGWLLNWIFGKNSDLGSVFVVAIHKVDALMLLFSVKICKYIHMQSLTLAIQGTGKDIRKTNDATTGMEEKTKIQPHNTPN